MLWSSAGIEWPVPPDRLQHVVLSQRDSTFPTLDKLRSPFVAPDGITAVQP